MLKYRLILLIIGAIRATTMPGQSTTDHPMLKLNTEDLSMVASFVLASGSIKALAKEYAVSYPTMRQRLDALIERLKRLVDGGEREPLSDYLADLIAKGQLAPSMATQIRSLHRQELAKYDLHKSNGDEQQ